MMLISSANPCAKIPYIIIHPSRFEPVGSTGTLDTIQWHVFPRNVHSQSMFIANQCLAQIAQIKSHNQGNWGTKNSDKKNTNMDLTWHILTCRLATKWPRPTPTSSLGVFFSTSINFAASTFPWWTMVRRWKHTTSKVAAQQKTTTVKRNRYQQTNTKPTNNNKKTLWKNFLFFSESWREHGPWNGWALRKRESEHQ